VPGLDYGPGPAPIEAELPVATEPEEPVGLSIQEVEKIKTDAVTEVEDRFTGKIAELESGIVRGQALATLSAALAVSDGVDAIYAALTRGMANLASFDAVVVFELDEAISNARVVLATGPAIEGWGVGSAILPTGNPFETVATKKSIFVSCVEPAEFGAVSATLRPVGAARMASLALVPMVSRGAVRGIIALATTSRNAYVGKDLRDVETAGALAASGAESSRRTAAAKGEAALAAALADISRQVNSTLDEAEVYGQLAAAATSIFKQDRLVISTVDNYSGELNRAHFVGIPVGGDEGPGTSSLIGTPTEEALRTGEVVVLSGLGPEEIATRYTNLEVSLESGLTTFAIAPLIAAGERFGSIEISTLAENAYSVRTGEMLSKIAAQVAPAIRNARLHTESLAPDPKQEIEHVVWTFPDTTSMLGEVALRLGAIVPFEKFSVWAVDVTMGTLVNTYVAVRSGDTWIPTAPQDAVSLVESTDGSNGVENGKVSPDKLGELVNSIAGEMASTIPVPLVYADEAVGMVSVGAKAESAFTAEQEVLVMSVAKTLGVRIGQAHAGMQSQLYAHAMYERLTHFEGTATRQAAELHTATQELAGLKGAVYGNLRESLDVLGTSARSMAPLVAGENGGLSSEDKQRLRQIVVSGHTVTRTLESVAQLRHFDEVDAVKETVDITALAAAMTETMRANDPGRTVAVTITENLQANSDSGMVQALLQHLVANAWTQTEGRENPAVQVGMIQQNGKPAFYVRDNGPGSDPDTAEALIGQTNGNGTAIASNTGLAVARQVVEKHGGYVQVVTEQGVGTTVFFTL
jgi:signal transduction histidine kinase